MKVLLTTLNSKYSHVNIALYYLKNRILDLADVDTLNLNVNDELSNNLSKIISYEADVVCFGVYVWNIDQTLKIAENIKKVRPKTIISFGGPEVSYNKEEILQKYNFVDSILCLESENNIIQFIKDVKINDIKNIYEIPVTISDIPDISDNLVENYDNRAVYFETSRGCPFRCSYCLSCIDKNMKYFVLENVKNQLKQLLDLDVIQIRFIDRTFNSNKQRAIEIWKFLLQNRKNTTFHFEICASLIDDDTLNFLKNVPKDIFRFEIGIQSTNEKTLEEINRKYNFDYEQDIIRKLVKLNTLHIHTDLIIGLPYETLDIFKHSFNDLYELNTTEIQLGFLKFLKGTDIYNRKDKFKYIYLGYPPYEVLNNIFMSYDEISYLKKFETVFESLYNSKKFIQSIKYIETKFSNYYEMYEYITNYFIKNKLTDRKISYDEIYESLIKLFNNDIILTQTLTYDYSSNFKGTRNWMHNKYNLKEEISNYISENKDTKFKNITLTEILKKYKFIVLDYNIYNALTEKTFYTFVK
ncbi:MAG: DUF4080 domain-containing protein [Clostridia bacterium]|nr:DUF4080 domain-containing protein [Clostridia bacterium]MDD4387289.1 DUF4080 domain-containing protein [Clostridia bacterium]